MITPFSSCFFLVFVLMIKCMWNWNNWKQVKKSIIPMKWVNRVLNNRPKNTRSKPCQSQSQSQGWENTLCLCLCLMLEWNQWMNLSEWIKTFWNHVKETRQSNNYPVTEFFVINLNLNLIRVTLNIFFIMRLKPFQSCTFCGVFQF